MSSIELDTRERIMEAALRLMEQHRGQGVRLEDIAREAKVSRQAVYLHFGSRSELFIATARYLDDRNRVSQRLEHICNAEDPVWALDAYIAFWANYIPEIYHPAKALLRVRETDEAAEAAWADRMNALYQGCLTIVQGLARDHLLDEGWTVHEAADYFFAAISFAGWEVLTIERDWTNEQYIARTQQVLRRALLRQD